MTDTAGGTPPFPGFPGFPPAEMLDKMWDMMRLTPFGAAFPGMQPGMAQGLRSPLAAMSDMMSPLTSVEELDKRITDMRAVEQWLKLNLNMLQSAIQGFEVQRATLSTLRAFGAFAQASMTQPAEDSKQSNAQANPSSSWSAATSRPAETERTATSAGEEEKDAEKDAAASGAEQPGAFDPSGWWNLLQSQFNQLAAFAMTQPGTGTEDEAGPETASAKKVDGADAKRASAAGGASASAAKPAAKRAPARKTGTKPAGRTGGGTPSGHK